MFLKDFSSRKTSFREKKAIMAVNGCSGMWFRVITNPNISFKTVHL